VVFSLLWAAIQSDFLTHTPRRFFLAVLDCCGNTAIPQSAAGTPAVRQTGSY